MTKDMNTQNSMKTYVPAYVGSKTAHGGTVVTGTSGCEHSGVKQARVGDWVQYPNGSKASIISGAGSAQTADGYPIAIVGSHIEGDDQIIDTPVHGMELLIDENNRPEGFLVKGWTLPKE